MADELIPEVPSFANKSNDCLGDALFQCQELEGVCNCCDLLVANLEHGELGGAPEVKGLAYLVGQFNLHLQDLCSAIRKLDKAAKCA